MIKVYEIIHGMNKSRAPTEDEQLIQYRQNDILLSSTSN